MRINKNKIAETNVKPNTSFINRIKTGLSFGIGVIGSKLILFLLWPLYTNFLSADEIGEIDLISNTLMLLVPIVTLSIGESILIFGKEKNLNPKQVFNNGMLIIYAMLVALIPLFLIFAQNPMILFSLLILVLQSMYVLVQQQLKVLGKFSVYAESTLLDSVITGGTMFIALKYFSLGTQGFLITRSIGLGISLVYLLFIRGMVQQISIPKVDKKLLKEMLKYSIPIIPSGIIWFIIQLSDRYFVSFYLGLSATGIYAIANKIPSLLYLINIVFYQSWQVMILEKKENVEDHLRRYFSFYASFLIIISSIMMTFSKWLANLLFASDFAAVGTLMPFIYIGIVFNSLGLCLSSYYFISKNSKAILLANIFGGILNVILNIMLIPVLGIIGGIISTSVSYILIFLIHVTKTGILKKYQFKGILVLSFLILSVQAALISLGKWETVVQQSLFPLILFVLSIPVILSLLKKDQQTEKITLSYLKKKSLRQVKSIYFSMMEKKQTMSNGVTLTYLLKKNNNSKELQVIFSSLATNGKAGYNYVKTLQQSKANRLYILDDFGYQQQGAFYLGEKGGLEISQAVEELLNQVSKELQIAETSYIGSSKGGFAALYFGMSLNATEIMISAPIFKIASFLNTYSEATRQNLASLEGDLCLDSLLENRIENTAYQGAITLFYSEEDELYSEQIAPLIQSLKKANYRITLVKSAYGAHQYATAAFAEYLKKQI